MAQLKRKVVFTAEVEQVRAIEEVVRAGGARTASEFLRQAVDEKLARIRRARLAEQVARYAGAGHADGDADLIAWQADDGEE
jgi:Arc/MetJ-type ribon-helix-helix transcriptional regulator